MAAKETWDYEKVRQLHIKERRSPLPVKLTGALYDDLMGYLAETTRDYHEARRKDPASQETMLLEEEHRKVKRLVRELFEFRERKIILMALSRSKGERADTDPLTMDEEEFMKDLLGVMRDRRAKVLEGAMACRSQEATGDPAAARAGAGALDRGVGGAKSGPQGTEAGETGALPVAAAKPAGETSPGGSVTGEAGSGGGDGRNGEGGDGGSAGKGGKDPCEYVTARILTDMDTFTATDLRTYSLRKEDVVSLPRDTASILIARGMAELIGPDLGCRV